MKCTKCGTEHNSKFCPECGMPAASAEPKQWKSHQETNDSSVPVQSNNANSWNQPKTFIPLKSPNPIATHAWIIIVVVMLLIFAFLLMGSKEIGIADILVSIGGTAMIGGSLFLIHLVISIIFKWSKRIPFVGLCACVVGFIIAFSLYSPTEDLSVEQNSTDNTADSSLSASTSSETETERQERLEQENQERERLEQLVKEERERKLKENQQRLENILTQYEENEIKADDEYRGQTLTISGYVINIGKDIVDDEYITIHYDDSYIGLEDVQCYFTRDSIDELKELKKGDLVTITGECNGKAGLAVLFKKCTIESP